MFFFSSYLSFCNYYLCSYHALLWTTSEKRSKFFRSKKKIDWGKIDCLSIKHTHTHCCYGNIRSKNDTPNDMVPRHIAVIKCHKECASVPEYDTLGCFLLFSVLSLEGKGTYSNGNEISFIIFFSGSPLHKDIH